MGRRLLVAVAVLTAWLGTPTPADAHQGVCAVTGTLTLAAGFVHPLPGVAAQTTSMVFDAGPCTGVSGAISGFASGTMTGWCGNATAVGVISGHGFSAVVAGLQITLSGGATGTLAMIPAVGESCTTPGPGADRFLLDGVLTVMPHSATKCLFSDIMKVDDGLYLNAPNPAGGPAVTTTFRLPGFCYPKPPVPLSSIPATAFGNISGWCGNASGSGSFNARPFTFVHTGTTMTFSGAVYGTLNIVPNAGHTCDGTGPGASEFLVWGGVFLS